MEKYYRFIPVLIYSMLIYYLSSLPSENIPDSGIINQDIFLHLIEYSIYGLLISFAFTRKIYILPVVIGVIFAGSDELHQMMVPTRFASVWDWLVDVAGVVLGVVIFNKYIRRFHERRKEQFQGISREDEQVTAGK